VTECSPFTNQIFDNHWLSAVFMFAHVRQLSNLAIGLGLLFSWLHQWSRDSGSASLYNKVKPSIALPTHLMLGQWYLCCYKRFFCTLTIALCTCQADRGFTNAAFDNCIRARSERSDLIIERFYLLKNRVKKWSGWSDRSDTINERGPNGRKYG
jgi:hypothetical protein